MGRRYCEQIDHIKCSNNDIEKMGRELYEKRAKRKFHKKKKLSFYFSVGYHP